MRIKAIETMYKGYRFRSKLEAKWAVFFDALGIEWEYEPQGFEMSDETRYLPDFRVMGTWCEVKFQGGDFSKAIQFAAENECRMWICEGLPDYAIYKTIFLDHEPECVVPRWDQAQRGDRLFYEVPCELPCGRPCRLGRDIHPIRIPKEHFSNGSHIFPNAVRAVRAARFEHGETPWGRRRYE